MPAADKKPPAFLRTEKMAGVPANGPLIGEGTEEKQGFIC
jgi:hypothetical protein